MRNINKKESEGLRILAIPFYVISFVWLFIVLSNFFQYHPINLNILYLFETTGQFRFFDFLTLLLNYAFAALLLAGILLGAFFLGSKINHILKIKFNSPLEKFIFSISLGMGALAYLIFGIGVLGLLYKGIIFALWAVLSILGIREIIPLIKNSSLKQKIPLPYKLVGIFVLLVIIFNFFISFTPEMFYDTLNYHLGVPNFYRVNHRILPVPFKLHAHFPLTVSMLYTFAIILNDTVAKLINWSFGILIITGIIYFCKNFFKSINIGILSVAAFYTIPNVIFRSWTATNDMGLTLFTFLSLAALINSLTEKNNKWLILSAIFAGLIMGTKYTGIFFIFGMIMLMVFLKIGWSDKIKKILLWGLITGAVFSPWLIKNYVHSGNPVHPFMTRYFNVKYFHQANDASPQDHFSNPIKNPRIIKKLVTIPWELSIKGGGTQRFASPDYYMLGAVFLLFIPLFFFLKDKDKSVIYKLLIFALFSYIFWGLFSSSKIKYFSPAFPALSIVTGYVIVKLNNINKITGRLFIFVFFLLIFRNLFFMIPFAHNTYRPYAVLTGALSKDEYLSTSRSGYPHPSYGVYKYINKNLPQNAKVLIFGDAKCFYIRRNFTSFAVFNKNPLIEYLKEVNSSKDFYSYLKNLNYTHIVVNIGEAVRTTGYKTLYFSKNDFEILDKFWNKHIKKIYTLENVFLYEIIKDAPVPAPVNTIKQTYRIYKMQQANNHIRNKNWKEAITPLNDLLNKGMSDWQVHYLTGVCYYYLGKHISAKKHAELANQLNPDERTIELLKVLQEN